MIHDIAPVSITFKSFTDLTRISLDVSFSYIKKENQITDTSSICYNTTVYQSI